MLAEKTLRKADARERSRLSRFKYSFGGMRDKVLERDKFRCVDCGMSVKEHWREFGRDISIDHIDSNRKNNSLENLQTLCLRCHGNKSLKTNYKFAPRKVVQKTKNGKIVAKYSSIHEAARSIGCSMGNIVNLVRGYKGNKTVYGFKFEYDNN